MASESPTDGFHDNPEMKPDLSKISLVIDVLFSPLALVGAVANVAVSRLAGKLPLCTAIFDRLNVYRHFKPQKILEIGSGQSTLMAQLAIEANKREDPSYDCTQICVEPFENSWLERTGVIVHRTKVEELDAMAVESLAANDIIFIDSSHVIRPQGDVVHKYLNMLGRVRPGVLIHVHDIFTPHDYPETWVLHERRLWNEQYLLEAFLCFNRSFKIIGAVNWLWHNHPDLLTSACPMLLKNGGEPGSFWFTRIE